MASDREQLSASLNEIVRARHARIPEVKERLERLDEVSSRLNAVRLAALELPPEWTGDPAIQDAVARLDDSEIAAALRRARTELEAVLARYSRDSINIGVGGRARVGKSLLLQSISGLTDQQVPTGAGVNVTAVRSRIFHAASQQATISFHTRVSFLDEVVLPYFTDLNIPSQPSSLDDFQRLLPRLKQEHEDHRNTLDTVETEKWSRLLAIGAAIPNLQLDGGTRTLHDLSDLRRYVAYPTTADKDREDGDPTFVAPRDYLAVRDCRIEAPFPVSDLDRLALVDLPGLGETAAGIDQRIVNDLTGEVDVVLMLFRSATGQANIDDIDSKALDLIKRAQGAVRHSADFAWILVNTAPGEEASAKDLVSELHRRFNDKEPDSRHIVLQANAKDPASIHSHALLPVLSRLADRLPEMDMDVLNGAVAAMAAPLSRIQNAATQLQAAISTTAAQTGSARQRLDDLADALRKDVQSSLAQVRPARLAQEYLPLYLEAIDAIHAEVKDWLSDGLGLPGRDAWSDEAVPPSCGAWINEAKREWGLSRSHGPFANSELHRLRVEITSRYATLDLFLNDTLVEAFYTDICDSIAGQSPGSVNQSGAERAYLVGGPEPASGSHRLNRLAAVLQACDPQLPALTAAVDRLRGMRFDFRLQSYPLLYDLNRRMQPEDSTDAPFPPLFARESTEFMYEWFLEEFTQYSFRVKGELLQDAERQFRVLAGAALVFEDDVSRSGRSSREFRDLAEGYRNELWPRRFDDINRSSTRAKALSNALRGLSSAVERALDGNG